MWEEKNSLRTTTLMKRLFKAQDLPAFMEKNEVYMQAPSFAAYINRLCEEYGLVPERVIKQAQIERSYGHQLFNGTRTPSRDKALQLAFAFRLNVEQTQDLLRLAGKGALYPKLKRDAVIINCLSRGKNMFQVQEALAFFGLTLLGGEWKHGS